uniref:Secreted protein n=1 Tax=Triticum urartu TaxID=4572 RepID=A0A8R7TGC7_TRIUA
MQRRSRAARWSWCAILAVPTSSTWPRLRPSGVVQCPRNMQLASSLHAVPAARESSTRPRACLSGAARCSCPCSLLLYSTTMATKAWSPGRHQTGAFDGDLLPADCKDNGRVASRVQFAPLLDGVR